MLNQVNQITVNSTDLTFLDKTQEIHVLHVDDDACMLEITKQILLTEGNFKIDTALNVDDALKKLETGDYDVVISDFEMPQKNGLEFLTQLRRSNNEIPFILFTGKGREEVAIKALNLGANGYYNKQGSPETVYGELSHGIRMIVENKRIKKAKMENDTRFKKLSAQTSGMLYQFKMKTDRTFCVPFVNEAIQKMFGCSPQDVRDDFSPIAKVIVPEDFDKVINSIKYSAEHLTPWVCEYRVQIPGQEVHWMWGQSIPEKLANGEIIWYGYNVDVTERKKLEEKLLESEDKFRKISNSAMDAIILVNSEGKIVYYNPAAEKTFGYLTEEALNKPLETLLIPPQHRGFYIGFLKQLSNSEKIVENSGRIIELSSLRKGSPEFPMELSISALKLKGKPCLLGIARDISERKKTEELLRVSEEKYRSLFENAGDVIYTADLTGRITSVNKAIENYGFKREKIIGNDALELIPKKYWPRIAADLQQLTQGNSTQGEIEVITPIGKKDAEYRGNPIWENGKIVGSQVIIRDISERKKMDDTLKQNQVILEAITENLGAGFAIISKEHRVLYANKFVKNNCGGEIEGKQCYAALHNLDRICADCGAKKIFEYGVDKDSHECFQEAGKGNRGYFVEIITTPLKDKAKNVTAALEFIVDIAEKKQMQQKLQASETKFRAINESAIDAIFMFDEEDRIAYWNPAAEKIFGYKEKEIIGAKVSETIIPTRFTSKGKFSSKLGPDENKKKTGKLLEVPARRKDGTEFPMEISMAALQLEGKRCIVAIARDITDRIRAEEKLSSVMDQLVLVNEKLGVVGSLTRHDVRNKLSAIKGYSYLIKNKNPDQTDIAKSLDKMMQIADEIEGIINFAKTYEQLGVERLTSVNVSKVLDEAKTLFSGKLPLIVNECNGLTVLADSFLRQMFYNFIDNTRKYGKTATTIRVYYEKADETNLRLIYEDDGVGIPLGIKSRLFNEGFSTGNSTGFGLFLIKKMMEIYGWQIQELGEPGQGAKFVITIPQKNKNGQINYQIESIKYAYA
ncbi:MAG: PAS domain S-box protein [Candidatus Bathyarchaeota archaeon]|nr:PAS domain S-box protein [Candidatus Bathyarchaeota archaeon]